MKWFFCIVCMWWTPWVYVGPGIKGTHHKYECGRCHKCLKLIKA